MPAHLFLQGAHINQHKIYTKWACFSKPNNTCSWVVTAGWRCRGQGPPAGAPAAFDVSSLPAAAPAAVLWSAACCSLPTCSQGVGQDWAG